MGQGRVGRAAGIDRCQRGIFHPPTPSRNTPLALDMQVRPLIIVSLQTVQGECSSSLVFLWNMGRWNRVSHVNFVKK